MGVLSGIKRVKRYVKESSGYKLLSQWASSQTVEMDDGTVLENKIATMDEDISKKAPIHSPELTGIPKAPTPTVGTNNTEIATTEFVQLAVSNGIAASDAMIFKGTIGTNPDATISVLPNTYMTGWTYRVTTEGTYAGQVCEIGDLVIALVDRSGSGNQDSDWCVAQTNIDGAITKIKFGDNWIDCSQTGSTVTIYHKDVERSDYSSKSSVTNGDILTIIKSIQSDEKGHITGVETEDVTLDIDYSHIVYFEKYEDFQIALNNYEIPN